MGELFDRLQAKRLEAQRHERQQRLAVDYPEWRDSIFASHGLWMWMEDDDYWHLFLRHLTNAVAWKNDTLIHAFTFSPVACCPSCHRYGMGLPLSISISGSVPRVSDNDCERCGFQRVQVCAGCGVSLPIANLVYIGRTPYFEYSRDPDTIKGYHCKQCAEPRVPIIKNMQSSIQFRRDIRRFQREIRMIKKGQAMVEKKLTTIGDMREHLATLMVGLRSKEVTVEEAMAAARLAEQVNAAFFAEAKAAKLMLDQNQNRPAVGDMPLNKTVEQDPLKSTQTAADK